MTYREALDIINDTRPFRFKSSGYDYDAYQFDLEQLSEAKDVIKRLVEETERFKWHDLRDNPEDLPETNKYVLVEDEDGDKFSAILRDEDSRWQADCIYANSTTLCAKVVSWREI